MRAANKAQNKAIIDEKGRRKNAAQRARALAQKKADSMPVVNPLDGPKRERVVDAELVDPSPHGGIGEVLSNRYLLRLIVRRELAQMYAASLLGLMWSYVQPAMRFGTYYLIMGLIMKMHKGTPYFAIHLFVGMVFVHYFTETWNGGTRSIWQNRALVLKMRMPREVFPIASAVVARLSHVPADRDPRGDLRDRRLAPDLERGRRGPPRSRDPGVVLARAGPVLLGRSTSSRATSRTSSAPSPRCCTSWCR